MIEKDIILSEGEYVYAPEKLNGFLTELDLIRILKQLSDKNYELFCNFSNYFGDLDRLISSVYDNESAFLKKFAQKTSTDLIHVSTDGENLYFKYLLQDGPTITNQITLKEYKDWNNGNNLE